MSTFGLPKCSGKSGFSYPATDQSPYAASQNCNIFRFAESRWSVYPVYPESDLRLLFLRTELLRAVETASLTQLPIFTSSYAFYQTLHQPKPTSLKLPSTIFSLSVIAVR